MHRNGNIRWLIGLGLAVDTTYDTPRVDVYTHGPEIGINFIIKT